MTGLAERIEEQVGGRRAAVVGVGNRLRGDDGAGSLVAERLRAAGVAHAFDAETVPENFLGALLEADPQVVLFVDAVDLGGAPGECRLVPLDALASRADTTHAPSLTLLARILEARGIRCRLLGIQPAGTALGAGLSPAVSAAAQALAATLAAALAPRPAPAPAPMPRAGKASPG